MYTFFRQAIEAGAYTDLNAFLAKLRAAWGRELLTDEQLDELTAAAQGGEARKRYNLQEEIDSLWAAVRRLQNQLAGGQDGEGGAQNEPGDFAQPSGAHDAYGKGDRVRFKGKIYISLLDGNVWAPDVYPAAWEEQK